MSEIITTVVVLAVITMWGGLVAYRYAQAFIQRRKAYWNTDAYLYKLKYAGQGRNSCELCPVILGIVIGYLVAKAFWL